MTTRAQFDQLIDEVATKGTHVTIERDGQPLARLEPTVSAEQREIDAMLQDLAVNELAAIGLAFRDVPIEEHEREVARALEEGRIQRIAGRENSSEGIIALRYSVSQR